MQAQTPWEGRETQPSSQVVAGVPQQQFLAGQPANPQILYVNAPAFKPSPNFRHISYVVIGFGVLSAFLVGVMSSIAGFPLGIRFINSICCGSIGIACILDAMYYNDKSTWQSETGGETTSSTLGMIVDIVFALLCLGIALVFLIVSF